ncbi:MAG: hypothetical protein NVV62_04835 [Terricaulis sp.]|nr:hypothetical protein [Terricaulis sp.]
MTTFVLIAVLGSIGLTLLLASLLWRINRPRGDQDGDGGAAAANSAAAKDADGGDSGDGGGGGGK